MTIHSNFGFDDLPVLGPFAKNGIICAQPFFHQINVKHAKAKQEGIKYRRVGVKLENIV